MKQWEKQCKVQGCNNRARSRDLCVPHYMRWKRHGDPYYKPARKTVASSDSNRALILDCEKKLAYARAHYATVVGLKGRMRWRELIRALESQLEGLRA